MKHLYSKERKFYKEPISDISMSHANMQRMPCLSLTAVIKILIQSNYYILYKIYTYYIQGGIIELCIFYHA